MHFLDISVFFIVLGIVTFSVVLYYRYLINRTIRKLRKIIEINKKHQYDLEIFLNSIEPILKSLGIKAYGYEIYNKEKLLSRKKASIIVGLKKTIKYDDYKVRLTLIPKVYRGEYKDQFHILLEVLSVIIYNSLAFRKESIDQSFQTVSKYHTFLLHDLKNINQFFQTLQFNIANCKTDEKRLELISMMKTSSQLLANKSDKLIKLLEQNSTEIQTDDITEIHLKTMILTISQMYNLKIHSNSDDIVFDHSQTVLYMVFENIITNLKEKQKEINDLKVDLFIEESKNKVVVIFHDNGYKIKDLNKIFEPFYTTKQNGLGIGLYKVKSLLESTGNSINAVNVKDGVEFKIVLER